ncbi:hypothetical protein CAFEA_04565 [Corynebacterium afermentans subsp. afermentans]|uniref:Bacteriophage CI repressor N-terminal domain-containing protein n=1 Tax=Corynebacterium afermentans TaxID=38286 RepID=A0A9X8R1Y7_9CORY|nr:helix-turn-helix domain-containing protein [Corynebacterium afermentans]OAA17197.1 hypothetical protein Caferm_09700 [Corynebacterium afermentans subsp. afermentans]WJY56525.1 hypothetical protein CAFEA_04565 [Corynebacterium afermentans subsp. afermentans]SIQ07227.1 hypothetical protein SAMN05421802_105121 [Corynebacterium afermentans]
MAFPLAPRDAFPDWPDIDPTGLPEAYARAWTLRDNLTRTIERFIANGWASSQSDFANRCGVSHSALSTWLSGSKWPATWLVQRVEYATQAPLWPRQVAAKTDRRPLGGDYDFPPLEHERG